MLDVISPEVKAMMGLSLSFSGVVHFATQGLGVTTSTLLCGGALWLIDACKQLRKENIRQSVEDAKIENKDNSKTHFQDKLEQEKQSQEVRER